MEIRESGYLSRVPLLLKAKLRMRLRSAGFNIRRESRKGTGAGHVPSLDGRVAWEHAQLTVEVKFLISGTFLMQPGIGE